MTPSFTPYFLRKLDAYQEIRRQDRLNRGPWPIEKVILIWGGSEHNHLDSTWKYDDIKKRVQSSGINDNELIPAIGNLKVKKLVEATESRENISKFTDEGIVMGEVLFSIQKPWKRLGYWISLKSFQLLIPVLLLTAFAATINQLVELIKKV
jgi:hypothetical protein